MVNRRALGNHDFPVPKRWRSGLLLDDRVRRPNRCDHSHRFGGVGVTSVFGFAFLFLLALGLCAMAVVTFVDGHIPLFILMCGALVSVCFAIWEIL